jgi:hypothetical protein
VPTKGHMGLIGVVRIIIVAGQMRVMGGFIGILMEIMKYVERISIQNNLRIRVHGQNKAD